MEITYQSVSWTVGDVITEGKLDTMVANDQAVDAHAQGIEFAERADPATPGSNKLHLFVKDKDSIPTLYSIDDSGQIKEVGEGLFWRAVPGTPTRVSNTQFTITDTGNANKYDKVFQKGTVLKWLESGTINKGIVISSSYAANTVTINILGDSLSVGFTSMKYAQQLALVEQFAIAGSLSSGTDQAKTWYAPFALYVVTVDAYLKNTYTGSANTFDVNDDGATIITTKPSITAGNSSDIDNVTDMGLIGVGSAITIDIDSNGTPPSSDGSAYLYLFMIPESWLYRT